MDIAKIFNGEHDAIWSSHNTMPVRCGAFPLRASPIGVFKRGTRSDDRVLAKTSRSFMCARLCPTATMPAHAVTGVCHGVANFAGDASAPAPLEWSSCVKRSMPVGCTVPSAPSARLTRNTIGPLRAHKDGVVGPEDMHVWEGGACRGCLSCHGSEQKRHRRPATRSQGQRGGGSSTHHVEPSLNPRRGGTRGGSGQEVPSRFARRSAARRDRTS